MATELASLFLSEKHKTLILLAIDSHIREMQKAGCVHSAQKIFEELEVFITRYDTAAAAGILWSYEAASEIDDLTSPEDIADVLENLDDNEVIDLYEACCTRLLADPDEEEPGEVIDRAFGNDYDRRPSDTEHPF